MSPGRLWTRGRTRFSLRLIRQAFKVFTALSAEAQSQWRPGRPMVHGW